MLTVWQQVGDVRLERMPGDDGRIRLYVLRNLGQDDAYAVVYVSNRYCCQLRANAGHVDQARLEDAGRHEPGLAYASITVYRR